MESQICNNTTTKTNEYDITTQILNLLITIQGVYRNANLKIFDIFTRRPLCRQKKNLI